jgi:Family of unknown function (DUF6515)
MKFPIFNRIPVLIALLIVGAFCPNVRADWGSLHGNNRSASGPSAAPRPQPQQMQPQQINRAPQINREPEITHAQPIVHAELPTHQEIKPIPEYVEPARLTPAAMDHARVQPQAVDRARAGETDRRRMDIDEDRRQSFFWSDYHAGMRIDRLPDGYRRIHVRDHDFFFFGGVFYDDGPSGYVVCAPPVDADIPELPPGTETVVVGGTVYYYVAGAFYVQQPDGSYIVVAAPMGVTVSLLPPDATAVVINGTTYYQADGTFYLPVMQNGVTAYLTVPQP